jgi:nucleoside 2-deoxyribosyltransferase
MTDINTNSGKNLNKPYIYIASPLFCDADHKGLDIVESMLDELSIPYFSPRHDSSLDLRSAKTKEERDQIAQAIFDLNKKAVDNADLVLVNTVGTRWNNAIYSDAGTMVEAGIAITHEIPIVTYNFFGYGLNIMLSQEVVSHADFLKEDGTGSDKFKVLIGAVWDEIQHAKKPGVLSITPKFLRTKFFKGIEGELV